MKITNRKKALIGFAASTLLVLGGCESNSESNSEKPEVYGPEVHGPLRVEVAPVYGVDYGPSPTPIRTPTLVPKPDNYKEQFYISEIPDEMYERDEAVYTDENCPIKREDLRYLHVLYRDRNKMTQEGELIVNQYIAEDVLEILLELYKANYQIKSIGIADHRIVEDRDLVCSQAIKDNISMCFRTYSLVDHEVKHGLGLALDINPKFNPYMENGEIVPIMDGLVNEHTANRDSDFPFMIRDTDLCVRLFKEHGFEWGGDWEDPKNYMHFEIPDDVVEQWYPGVLGEE